MSVEPMKLGTAPGRFPLLSHSWSLLRRPLGFLTSLRDAGAMVKIRFGKEWAYLVQHPELIRQVLVTDTAVFDKGGPLFDKVRLLLGNGLGSCPHAMHRPLRRLMQPAFHRDRLATYADIMQREASNLADSWRPGAVIHVPSAMRTYMLALVTRTLCIVGNAEAMVELRGAIPFLLEGLYNQMLLPGLLQKLPLPANRRFERAFLRVRALTEQVIEDYRRAGIDHGDLLSMLLAARDELTHEGLTNDQIYDQVLTFLSGSETGTSTLSWAFHVLGQRPDVERRLHAEVDEVLAGQAARYEDIPRLAYTTRFLTEALRLYSPGWLISRRTVTDTELGGHRLPGGTTILISFYAMHRDPTLFAEPDRFDPDRWLPERAASLPRFAMMPFGAGQRKCIADSFGMAADTLALATIARRWRLRPLPGDRTLPVAKLTLNPGDLRMRTEPRLRE